MCIFFIFCLFTVGPKGGKLILTPMGFNQSLAEQFLNEAPVEEDPYQWIVVYDFLQEKPSPKFWKNLNKLTSISTVTRIQYSVLMAEKKGDALAAQKLAFYYGAEVKVFKCEREGGSLD